MTHRHRPALGAMVAAFALLLVLQGVALPSAWLPIEEAAVLAHARGGASDESPSAGILYPALLAPAARTLSPASAHALAKALSAVLWASVAIPAYLLARRLVPPGASLVVAGLAVVIPASVYATAAVPDALAVLLGACSLPLLSRASEHGSTAALVGAVSLAAAAALARPWLVVLPLALLVAYGLPRARWRSLFRWPRSLAFAALAGVGYLVLGATAPDAAIALASPEDLGRAAAASLAVAAVGAGVVPWLLAASRARPVLARPETALLATCVPALALAAGVLGAAAPGRGLDERPLLVLGPLVLALAASAWLGGDLRMRVVGMAAAVVVLAALALSPIGRAPSARAAGLSLISPEGGSRAFLAAGVAAAVAVALLLVVVARRRPIVVPAVVVILLLVGQAAAWSSVRDEARDHEAAEPAPRGWVDRHAGSGARVVVAGPAAALDELVVAHLTLWNRAVRGTQELDFSAVDPLQGQWGEAPAAEIVLVRGATELAGTEIARSTAGTLLRPQDPYRLAETLEGVYPDGWSGDQAVYRRHSGPPRAGTLVVSLGQPGRRGGAPAAVTIEAGSLSEDAVEPRGHGVLRPGQEVELEIAVPPPPFRVVVTIRPTFPAAELAAADGRQLGAQLRFSYHP